MSPAATDRPFIALAMGDAAGISPELTARILADDEIRRGMQLIVIGDRRVLAEGARVAGVTTPVRDADLDAPLASPDGLPLFIDLKHCDPALIEKATISASSGRFALTNFRLALLLAQQGVVRSVTFTPFNKSSMRLAYPAYEDEIVFCCEFLGFQEPAEEFNILPGVWNARVTSHVPLSGVASRITREAILRSIRLTDQYLRAAGHDPARIGVAALNPHAGDNGSFGREEIDIIGPAVEVAKAEGIHCDGPFPSDTVFVRARRGQFDAVVTMYHDQGQIAMKMIGLEEGVTLLGGFPFPICTPAHGTAFDIAGKGIAGTGASRNAVLLAAKMARSLPAVPVAAEILPLRDLIARAMQIPST